MPDPLLTSIGPDKFLNSIVPDPDLNFPPSAKSEIFINPEPDERISFLLAGAVTLNPALQFELCQNQRVFFDFAEK